MLHVLEDFLQSGSPGLNTESNALLLRDIEAKSRDEKSQLIESTKTKPQKKKKEEKLQTNHEITKAIKNRDYKNPVESQQFILKLPILNYILLSQKLLRIGITKIQLKANNSF